MTFRSLFVLPLALVLLRSVAPAQEVDCNVQVNYEAIPNANKDLLVGFADDLRNYLNGFTYGEPNTGVKVKVTVNIFLQSVTGENRYSAQIYVGSQRQIFKSDKNTAILRVIDDSWEFSYVRTTPLRHNPYTFDDLTSVLDFYMYLAVAFDNDTYDEMGGSSVFQRVSDVASLGRSSTQKGWNPSTATYCRAQLIDEIMNPIYAPVRKAIYHYHFGGLDSLAINRQKAQATIVQSIKVMGDVHRRADVRNILIRLFFDAKAKEIVDVLSDYPDPSVYSILIDADPSHQMVYEEGRRTRRD
jgi:hypothetical protein